MNQDSKFNLTEIENYIHKIKMYSTDEEGSLNKIRICLNDMSNCYQSKHSVELSDSNNLLLENLPIIFANREAYLKVFRDNRKRYEDIAVKNVKVFKNIEIPKGKVKHNG